LIHLVNIDSYEERILPPPANECVDTLHPAFSPDGKHLASMCVLTQGAFRIYVSRPDGTNPRQVIDVKSVEGFADLDWAADSRSLIYAAGMHLWRVALDGGKPERLLFAQDTESVTVARSGNRLAFAQVRHPGSLWQLPLAEPTKAGSIAAKVASSSRGDSWPRVSPDGRFLAFQSYRSGSPELWISDRDASNPVQLTFFGGAQIGPPSWSPDSHRIVFDVRASDKPELYVVNKDGGPSKQLHTGTLNACYPFWSGDGRSIYFSTEPPGGIWKVTADGGQAVRLTGDHEGGNAPQEAPGGKRVYYYKFTDGHTHAWSVSANGGDERSVEGMPGDVGWVLASSGIYFVQGAPRHFSLKYMDLASRRIYKVADLPGLFSQWGPSLSPNGDTFLLSGIEHSEADIILADGFQ
jgi:Tol biopolymer transport system component